MKNNRVFGAFGILTLLLITGFADVIVPNFHTVPFCCKLVNISEFPDIVVIGYLTPSNVRYIVNQDSCLYRGYKFGGSSFLWAPKHYVDSVGLDSLPIKAVLGLAKKTHAGRRRPIFICSAIPLIRTAFSLLIPPN
jgi:hypothetical protein